MTVDELWRELVTTALLGTDRRDPPPADGAIGELLDDTVRVDPSSRMLAQIAACTAVRRAGVLPGSVHRALAPPPADPRPVCTPAAVQRWHHITRSWPVLEDEWLLALIEQGWRTAPELVPALLHRHRRDPVRRARVLIAAGALAEWLVEHLSDLAPSDAHRTAHVDAAALANLPQLPIPPELADLLDASGAEIGGAIAVGLEDRTLVESHRAVLVNLLARCTPGGLVVAADVLDAVDPISPGRGLAAVLADLATTRHRMLDELSVA